MTGTILVALTATKAPWSSNFREYCREHTTDISVEVIVNVRSLLYPAHRQYDVLLIDDMMRLVGVADVAAAHDRQIHVVGLTDPTQGLGRKFLEDFGSTRSHWPAWHRQSWPTSCAPLAPITRT